MVTMVPLVATAPAVAWGAAPEPYLSVLLMTTWRPRPTMYAVPAWSDLGLGYGYGLGLGLGLGLQLG